MALDDKDWLTEICEEGGSAFSMKLKEKLHEEQTPYQRIAIYETEYFGTVMVIDGFVMLTDLDNFIYHEMMAHPALFSHPHPRRVLVIGGGDCGTLFEVLKHPEVERLTQVEIDERVTRLAEHYFPQLCASNGDPRADFRFTDGIRWVREAEDASYEAILVDSTDPLGPAEGLFTEAFYRECHRALAPQGVLVHQSESPLYHMDLLKAMRRAMERAGFDEVKTLTFPLPTYPSGWWSVTLAGKGLELSDFRKRPLPTRYYSAAIHASALALPPFLKEAL